MAIDTVEDKILQKTDNINRKRGKSDNIEKLKVVNKEEEIVKIKLAKINLNQS
ncbi:28896_t:CDS:1, partial [Dentiscutata erythropus]